MSDIKVITEPSVYLVGRSTDDPYEVKRFLDDNDVSSWSTAVKTKTEGIVEMAGRLCYMSFKNPRPGGNKAYIDNILESGHGSVLEHVTFSFIITGVSRSLTHELVRHRAGFSFSQLSQRFVDEREVAFVCPPALLEGYRLHLGAIRELDVEEGIARDAARDWLGLCDEATNRYAELSGRVELLFARVGDKTSWRKQVREVARSVLPNCTETKIFVTANARALRHFVELRGSLHADAEIRRLAMVILEVMKAEAPNLFADFSVEVAEDGRSYTKCKYHKV